MAGSSTQNCPLMAGPRKQYAGRISGPRSVRNSCSPGPACVIFSASAVGSRHPGSALCRARRRDALRNLDGPLVLTIKPSTLRFPRTKPPLRSDHRPRENKRTTYLVNKKPPTSDGPASLQVMSVEVPVRIHVIRGCEPPRRLATAPSSPLPLTEVESETGSWSPNARLDSGPYA